MRRGHFSVPPLTKLCFDSTKPFEFTVRNFKDLIDESPENAEQWVLPIEMFENLRTLRGRGTSACIPNAGITVKVSQSLNLWLKQVIIDLDIEEKNGARRPPTRLIIPWRDIKRFMRLVNKVLKNDPTAKDDYIEGTTLRLLKRY